MIHVLYYTILLSTIIIKKQYSLPVLVQYVKKLASHHSNIHKKEKAEKTEKQ